jgi:hypothetical protein
MSENEQQSQVAQSPARATGTSASAAGDHKAPGEYKVGKGRPPIEKRFKPGQSGNPKGRPRGRPNLQTTAERVLEESVPIRRGEKTQTVPMGEAIVRAHAMKAAQGDVRSAGFVFSLLPKPVAAMDDLGPGQETTMLGQPAVGRRPSAELFENVNPALVSEDDQVELSRLAAIVDLGGGMTALSPTDFARAREIVNKGRGEDVTASI